MISHVPAFSRYSLIGLLNTALHWAVFFVWVYGFSFSQGLANLIAFLVAVSFSFFMNARFTFSKQATGKRYVLFVLAMGIISYATGFVGGALSWLPLVTVVVFSFVSLILGFLYARFVIFR